ncbi:glycoside hydrolase family 17 protein [Limobrevibacterium gyesilva]|uniref:Endo-1,3-beta-glucanase btgC n=1 Tax=Limobrevibacterium gyesilva TaxID=2991712 RepID=A0AA42CEG0_9PROT|nr:glycosyl hydrolase family 17 protein [Limobrevibacterium gyesilva]MCW3475998.1 glycosyl hydrolase family 17 protein [Limobrevibacterium gyesilva]
MSRPTPWLLPLLAVLSALLVLLWWVPNRPRDAGPDLPDGKLNSVSFAPYRADQSPFDGTFPTAAQVDADMALLAGHVRAIRSYAAIEGAYDVAALAQKHGLKLWQGIWLGSDRAQNRREIARAIASANRYPDTVERVIVGNEVLLRRDLPPAELMAALDAVRAAVRQPVTYADVWEFWEQFPEVAAHVDIVTIHLLPYWEDHPTAIDRAIAHVDATYRHMAALFPGKPISVGETGWPSRGRWRADAAPGLVNQTSFVRRFVALAHQEGFDYNLIEAFDQVWKQRAEGAVGANWGLWTADRQPKFAAAGKVVENPHWRLGAAGGCVLGLVLLAAGLATPGLRAPAQATLAVLAMALGGVLGWAVMATLPDIYDAYQGVAAAGNLAGQALLAVLMTRRAAGLLAGNAVPPPRTGADATDAVRGLLRLSLPRRDWLFDDLGFVFVWTAAVLQLLLLFDPRYRDFPIPTFAVPVVAVLARALLRDLPRGGGGREELWAGGVLALAAIGTAVNEGPRNLQALAWTACALVLAAPPLLRCFTSAAMKNGR